MQGRNERNTVELRSDACEKTWKVQMDGRRLTVGWKEFAGAHDFRIGDIIVFRHEGNFMFHVTGFGPSCCEVGYEQNNIRNLSMEQNLKTELESLSDSSCFVANISDSNLREDRLFLPRKFVTSNDLKKGSNKIVLMNGVKTWRLNLRFRESSETFYMRSGWRRFCHENGLQSGDSITFKLESNSAKTPVLCFSTAETKSDSTKHRSEGKRKDGEKGLVTLTVTPASIKYCRLYLPRSFIKDNKMETAGGKKINLLDKHGVKWPVSLVMLKGNGQMHLGLGLREFLEATGVKANESFMLELDWEDTTIPPIFKFCSKIKI
ncbi:unnamed protein product [Arabis nemorensis]|uniref:TF-B3 domain-containing protein n=1 Tax=Arabis nemorensis TaxID=586526 RepID=A0A565CAW8_9BRAS|nr:unnamed protein product [Arabis nemorensis]